MSMELSILVLFVFNRMRRRGSYISKRLDLGGLPRDHGNCLPVGCFGTWELVFGADDC